VDELAGKAAVVTGGGSGIGRALVMALAEAAMSVVVADIDEDAARSVAREAEGLGVRSLAVATDVTDPDAVGRLADLAYGEFGGVDVLCNNAGVLLFGQLTDSVPEDWAWVFSVNVMGVVHGIQTFVPRMRRQGRPAHIVNTASVASLGGGRGGGVYSASKNAVLAISESLRSELEEDGIGVTALCPANIRSRILDAQRNRPPTMGRRAHEPFGTETEFGIDPMYVGRRAVQAIRDNQLYVFVVPEGWAGRLGETARARFDSILEAIEHGEVPGVS
jgi:NAD(P)-dependent dehydrogenase (short-subunit alcohol dehydrogenase family)